MATIGFHCFPLFPNHRGTDMYTIKITNIDSISIMRY